MAPVSRWFCQTCKRQWLPASENGGPRTLDAKGEGRMWTPADGCPRCHSMTITLTTFTPAFPGGDLDEASIEPPPAPIVVHARPNPTLTLSQLGQAQADMDENAAIVLGTD